MSRMEQTRTDRFKTALLLMAATGLIVGLAFYLAGQPEIANLIWIAGVVPALAALVVEIVRSIGRGEVGLDIVAALSMTISIVFPAAAHLKLFGPRLSWFDIVIDWSFILCGSFLAVFGTIATLG